MSATELASFQKAYGGSGSLESIDRDGDGAISGEELQAYSKTVASGDGDADGVCVGVRVGVSVRVRLCVNMRASADAGE